MNWEGIKGKEAQFIFTLIFVVGYFITLGMLLSGGLSIPTELKQFVAMMLVLLSREVGASMHFWFASSSGSKDKDK